ncbi:hypothetical protein CHUAL_009204 [Chamberlinius hualienensis]
MAVDLLKNKESMQNAWLDVMDDNKSTNWAVYSYEGKTFDLKLVSTGDGGLEEMVEELNSGKIMYALCRVIDPKTSLPKFLMINWQGEGVPGDRKGKCANHLRAMEDFFKGIHITINARTEDDVEPSNIMDKVSKSTGSVYSFKDRAGPLENHKPVGSVYKRIVPTAEINSRERDKFWEKQEEEEKQRLEEERKKTDEVKAQLEFERKKRELEDAKRREEFVKQRTKEIGEIRAAEKTNRLSKVETEKQLWQKQMAEDAKDDEARLKHHENKRLERNHEVESLIGQRTFNARAIFEQNTVVGQMSTMKVAYRASNQVKTPSVERSFSANGARNSLQDSDSSSSSLSYGKLSDRTPPSPEPETNNAVSTNQIVVNNADMSQYSATCVTLGEDSDAPDSASFAVQQTISSDNYTETNESEDVEVTAHCVYAKENEQEQEGQGLVVRALYDYQAADDTEISFNPDDLITHVDQIDEGWWQGLAPDGTYGLFPANYVEIVE